MPYTAKVIDAASISGNGHSRVTNIWWNFNKAAKSADVYLMVINSPSGHKANFGMLGKVRGERIDFFKGKGNVGTYTLLIFKDVWLNGEETLAVDFGAGGHASFGKAAGIFGSIQYVNYYNGNEYLFSDTSVSGDELQAMSWDDAPFGYTFLGWSYDEYAEGEAQNLDFPLVCYEIGFDELGLPRYTVCEIDPDTTISVANEDISLFAVLEER